MNAMKDQISRITLDTMNGIREGVGKARGDEFLEYVETLILAKENGLDIDSLQQPMLVDEVRQGVEAALSSTIDKGVEGGVSWKILEAKGSYGSEVSQGLRLKVDMAFSSAGRPDIVALQEMSVEDLKKLQEVIK